MKPKKENNQHVLTDCDYSWEYCIDAQGKMTYVSPFRHSATGLLPNDILKDPLIVSKSLHPDDRSVYENHIKNTYGMKRPGEVEYRVVLPDGSIRWFSHTCAPFFDEKGKYAGTKGRHWDITERKNMEHVITVQRDLGISLDQASSLQESLHLCLSAALNVSGLEAGGIYMLDQVTGELNLILASGHGDKFVKINSRLSPGSKPAQMIMAGRPFYLTCREIQDLQAIDLLEEKMCSLAAFPFIDKGQVFGSLQVGSRIHNEIPVHIRTALETVARQISAAVSRAQAEQNLRANEEKYRALFENVVIGIFQITQDGKILSVNPAMADIFGYDSLSSFRRGVTNITQIYVNPDDHLSILKEIERKGQVHKHEVPCLRKDGLEILVAVSARAYRDQNGHVTSYHGFIEDVTPPGKMEDALRKSEERFRSLIKSSRDAILMMDSEGRVSYWNPAAERMFGYESAEAAGRNLHELIAPKQYLEAHRSAFAEYLLTGRGTAIGKTVEMQATRKDGTEITVALSLSAELINDRWNAIGILRDITRQKEAESQREAALEALRETEKRYRLLFENSPIGIVILDPSTTRPVEFNETACRQLGYSREEFARLKLSDIEAIETPEEIKAHIKTIINEGRRTFGTQHRTKTGDIRDVYVTAQFSEIVGQQVYHCIWQDITDHKRAEEALRESEEKFRVLADSTPAAVLLYQDDRWIYANKATEAISGYSAAELLSMNFWDIVHPDFKQILQEEGRNRQQGKETTNRHELKIITKDGREKWVDLSGASTMLRGKLAGVLSVLDISERKKAEEEMREAHRRLDDIISDLPDATLVIDAEGKVIAWNRAIEQMTGINAADMLGKGNYEYALPFYGERRPILIDLVLTPSEDFEAEYVSTQRRDTVLEGEAYIPELRGGEAHLFVKASALKDSKGNVVGAIASIRDITARRRAEEKYQAIFENAVEGIFQSTPDGRILSVNPAMVKLSGYGSLEDLMQNVNNIIQFYANPDDRLHFRKEIEEKGTISNYEVLCVRKDGEKIWISVNARAIKDKEGHIIHYDGFFEDITEWKKMEDTLLKSEERYRMIVENTNDVIWIMDLNFQYKYRSPTNVQITGRTSEEIMSIPPREQVVPESYALAEKILMEELANEFSGRPVDPNRSRTIELEVYHKSGGTVWIEVTGSFGRDKNGNPVEILLVGREITERKKIQEALKESEKRYRMIVENMNDTIWTMDLNLRYNYISPDSNIITGFTEEELRTIPLKKQVTPESYARMEKLLMDELVLESSGRPVNPRGSRTLEIEAYHKDGGTIWIEIDATFNRAENGKPVEIVIAGRNITERKKMQKEKEALERQLIQAQKMEAIGTLAGGVAHDFNNILASMMGYTEMAIKETRPKMRRDYLVEVLQACDRAKNLVNQILAFSRMHEPERYPVDLRPILQEALSLLRAILPATIEIKKDITQEETQVLADPTQIHQVIINLCTNAAHAMQEKGGLLEIHLSNIEILHPAPAPYPDLPIGSYVRLSARDTGHGIDDAIKDKIFDPFFTTKKTKEGTGLGLSAVYGIVKSSGGSIDVQSSVGEGTTFTIFLPRTGSEGRVLEASQEEIDLQGHERILFVDDEEMLVKMTRRFFQNLGYRITATISSPEALRLFQENPGAFDLVITDMTMPQTTGMELSRALLKIRPELPIILCTGYSDSVNTAEARKLKIKELVLKPVSLNVLGRLVRRVLNG